MQNKVIKIVKIGVISVVGALLLLIIVGVIMGNINESKKQEINKNNKGEQEHKVDEDVVLIEGGNEDSDVEESDEDSDIEELDEIEKIEEDSQINYENNDSDLNIVKDSDNVINTGKDKQIRYISYTNNYLGLTLDYIDSWFVEDLFKDSFDIVSKLGGNAKLSDVKIEDKVPIVKIVDKDNDLTIVVSLNGVFYHDKNIKEVSSSGDKRLLDYFGETYECVVKKVTLGKGNVLYVAMYKKDKLLKEDIDILNHIIKSMKVVKE